MRACLTLPFWLPVFDEPPVVVFVHRHPGEFAEALHGARGVGRAHALAIWERCNHDVLTYATGLPTYALDHRAAGGGPGGRRREARRVARGMGCAVGAGARRRRPRARARARFHRAADPDRFGDPIATPEQRELFRILPASRAGRAASRSPSGSPRPTRSVSSSSLAGRARLAHDDAIATGLAFDLTAGSRRRLVRTFLERTLPERVLPRTGPTPGRPRDAEPATDGLIRFCSSRARTTR